MLALARLAQDVKGPLRAVALCMLTLAAALASAGPASAICDPSPCIEPNMPPAAAFTYSPSPALTGDPVTFDGSESSDDGDGGGIGSWRWSFGDGTGASGEVVSHTYTSAGTYTVMLTVTDNDGTGGNGGNKSNTTSQAISVVDPIATISMGTVYAYPFSQHRYADGGITYQATAGTASNLSVTSTPGQAGQICIFGSCQATWTPGSVTFTEATGYLRAGSNCTASSDGHSVTCDVDDSVLQVNAGDGNDRVNLSGLPAWLTTIDGGTGNDTITGGPGEDVVSYSTRSTPVTVNLATGTGGAAGESDTFSGIEDIAGGTGADTLSGNAQANVIDGGLGNDTISGAGGVDTVDYSTRSAAVAVTDHDGSGTGGQSGESDTLASVENVRTGGGNDTIDVRDSSVSSVVCGDGSTDTVVVDSSDAADYSCEQSSPNVTAAPTVSGTAEDEQTLTADPGTWSGEPAPTYAYQWRRCGTDGTGCADVSGATSKTLTLGHGDVGHTFYVVVTASNVAGAASSDSAKTAAVAAAPPVNTTPPAISGTAQVGQTLSADPGQWSGTPASYSYEWRRCDADGNGCAVIFGATGNTYSPTSGDAGRRLRVHVTATNAAAPSGVAADSNASDVVQPAAQTTSTTPTGTGSTSTTSTTTTTTPTTQTPGTTTPGTTVIGATQTKRCVVPKLRHKTLRQARRLLKKAHCRLGKVRKKRAKGRSGRVLTQKAKPRSRHRSGYRVAVVISRKR